MEQLQDLWPGDFQVLDVPSPMSIMEEQAALLPSKTEGLVRARIVSQNARRHFFVLARTEEGESVSPVFLFQIAHGLVPYPLRLGVGKKPKSYEEIEDENAFLDRLREIFASEETRRIVGVLMQGR